MTSGFRESDIYREPLTDKTRAGIAEAVAAARDVDVIVAVLGEVEEFPSESARRTSLDLPGNQEELLEALQATGKPGRACALERPAVECQLGREAPVRAIVEMWFPGERAGPHWPMAVQRSQTPAAGCRLRFRGNPPDRFRSTCPPIPAHRDATAGRFMARCSPSVTVSATRRSAMAT